MKGKKINNEGDSTTNTKRSYDCRFWQKVFTNPQALGGHLSIHLKDRAKAAMQAPTNPDDGDHFTVMQSWGEDLTLRTGSSTSSKVDEIQNAGSRRAVGMEDVEVDLELRLGHHP